MVLVSKANFHFPNMTLILFNSKIQTVLRPTFMYPYEHLRLISFSIQLHCEKLSRLSTFKVNNRWTLLAQLARLCSALPCNPNIVCFE